MEQYCRLCLNPLSMSESYYKITEHANFDLKEKISTLISGSPKVVSAFQCSCPAENSGSCPKPNSVCFQCKLDLDFYIQFSQRAKNISKRLDGIKCSEAELEIESIRGEIEATSAEGRPMLKKFTDSSGTWVINEVMTKDGKVAIPRLRQKHPEEATQDGAVAIEVGRSLKTKPMRKKQVKKRLEAGDRPFRCGFTGCQKAYQARHYLVDHERTHTGDKPFTCDCGKSFSRILNLKKHNLLKLCSSNKK